ncbi:MAG: aldehyde dehydrogenase family protein, partial [Polyangiaceae bacterium]|nr:aldehyde dehydrogenase family protein [Polyangiaceae bacterium]
MNPATGDVVGYSSVDSVEAIPTAIAHCRQAQRGWAETSVRDRCRAIGRVRDHLVENADDIAKIISLDNGKTRVDALATEVMPAIMAADHYIKNASRYLADRSVSGGNVLLANKVSKIVRVPFGVIGIISPWNYPFSIPFSEVVMGLIAGNAVILKVASETQLVGRALERAFHAGGLPHGLFAYINVPGRLAGNAMLESGVDKLFFTGSVPVGKKLMAKAAETLTPVSLELG